MTNSVITMVKAIEADYGMNPKNWAEDDPRLKALQKRFSNPVEHPKKVYKSDRLRKAQQLLDNTNLPKYKIAEQAGYNKDYFGTLCADGFLDDSKWYINRKHIHNYKYYCDNKLIAEGTINQIAMKLGKSPSSIRGCTLSSYKKYKHKHVYKLVKVR
ncbi:helix-turn-helix transcriptional regulator [Companilactobacillus alimentarius]|uniref:hypothetical protein n=1 Tax=Companilactobacillus alimentarius TaxID=1602 RepID=UPI0028B70163|nr:hypothetical protein [Companilactobacillus alimentarius]MDT6951850.1 hypothetical protein [Companilactobacillus alimentarius]